MDKQINIIESSIKDILKMMSIEAEINSVMDNDCPQFTIRTRESRILIGENGQNLIALNHLLKKIIESEFRKAQLDKIPFLLDINDYQAKKTEELKNLAKITAQRARYFKKEIEMEPMSAFERRIVHSVLTEYPDIQTSSIGEEPNRRVVIKLLG